ncbi:MAG TPA: glutamate-5-semialdehyde dehydrogenase [Candidatus Binatia bacterium]|jgi:glutamate-5-semialdehyde dehydrogenase|nr:glutamate-5-semialdehyde dehydrogenase [Candidatus Binatia bacterium]
MQAPISAEAERTVETITAAARAAARVLAGASTVAKDRALRDGAAGLREAETVLLDANRVDVERARTAGENAAFIDRLTLTPARIDAMAVGLEEAATLPDPIGETMSAWRRPNGIEIAQVRVPIGVILTIYESRPNVTADSAALCLKSGNAVLLKCGSESQHTSATIARVLQDAVEGAGIPRAAVQLVEGGREVVRGLLRREDRIDVVIARGGETLKRTIMEESRIPVVKHFEGICHLYVDAAADLGMAERICLNGKVQRPSVCNALENLVVHEAVAHTFLPPMVKALRAHGCEVRGDARTRAVVPDVVPASDADWDTEYLDLILSVRVVPSIEEAMAFIAAHGTGLAEAIVTNDYHAAERFLHEVDAAAVFVNASTRFTDGYEFGFGAEVGISTNRLHARGPMGLRELTSYKYQVRGNGQVRG